jgi:hypothetical protein
MSKEALEAAERLFGDSGTAGKKAAECSLR